GWTVVRRDRRARRPAHGDGAVALVLDCQCSLSRLRALGGARQHREDRAEPRDLSQPLMPTRITNSIRALRFANNEMTQAELAERVGVTRQTIIAIEQGRYSPSLEVAFLIARALNARLEEVFQYPDSSGDPEE